MVRQLFVVAVALALAGCATRGGAHPTDPAVRGFGTIGPDGRFALERVIDGTTAPETYRARLILNDEGDGTAKSPNVPARYLDFKTAGWSVGAATTNDVTRTVVPE